VPARYEGESINRHQRRTVVQVFMGSVLKGKATKILYPLLLPKWEKTLIGELKSILRLAPSPSWLACLICRIIPQVRKPISPCKPILSLSLRLGRRQGPISRVPFPSLDFRSSTSHGSISVSKILKYETAIEGIILGSKAFVELDLDIHGEGIPEDIDHPGNVSRERGV
jgi:hypothetical protein